jgi:glucokinase
MNYNDDNRIVMTLDAGGTNFVFNAIQGNKRIIKEIRLDSNADNLDRSLFNIVEGFTTVKNHLKEKPVAISFAFPGPADYENGIIGDLGNLPAYRGGVALGSMLKEKFNLPVFINNDGDLFAYGEAIAGFLPEVNGLLELAASPKRYKNLLGLTLGTGFGSGIVRNGELYLGDNSMAGEIWLLRNKLSPQENVEEYASKRGVRRIYAQRAGIAKDKTPSPKEIFEIATGKLNGNKEAAVEAYSQMARVVGDAISNAITMLDGLVVIGGGLAGASSLFMPFLIDEMRSYFIRQDGTKFKRLVANVYNLEEDDERQKFVEKYLLEIPVYGSNKKVTYDSSKKIGVGISKIGTSNAVAIGAYSFALHKLDNNR